MVVFLQEQTYCPFAIDSLRSRENLVLVECLGEGGRGGLFIQRRKEKKHAEHKHKECPFFSVREACLETKR